MIYLKPELAAALAVGGVDAVKTALQAAVKLEHSTIPPYLYALYSLNEEKNPDIAAIIQSVVVEEMLHMTLACNVLNALGGSPEIDTPDFIPDYPGNLPGGVDSSLKVGLAPFSMPQLEAFLEIEHPLSPIPIPDPHALGAEEGITIGQYYGQIIDEIRGLKDADFASTPSRNQIDDTLMPEAFAVTSIETAVQALHTIIDQGEGTPETPREVGGTGEDVYAHFYRFQQIQAGSMLVDAPGKKPPFTFTGRQIIMDLSPDGVYPVPSNPTSKLYPQGSAARAAFDTFNYTYTSLLKALHATFNGAPENLRPAIGLMMSLKSQGKGMMSGDPAGEYIGPSFEYLAVLP